MYAVTIFHYVQHAQGIDGRGEYLTISFVEEYCAQIHGHGGYVQLTGYQAACDFIGAARVGYGIIVLGLALLRKGTELGHAYAGGALHCGNVYGELLLWGAGGAEQQHEQGHHQCGELFHKCFSFLMVLSMYKFVFILIFLL